MAFRICLKSQVCWRTGRSRALPGLCLWFFIRFLTEMALSALCLTFSAPVTSLHLFCAPRHEIILELLWYTEAPLFMQTEIRLSWTKCTVLPVLWPRHASKCQLVRQDVLTTSIVQPGKWIPSFINCHYLYSLDSALFSRLPMQWKECSSVSLEQGFSTSAILTFRAGKFFIRSGGAVLCIVGYLTASLLCH